MTEIAIINENGAKKLVMASINVSLPETLKAYVEEQVASGSYGTVSEYVRELIRLDQKRKAQVQLELRLLEGLDSGHATEMTQADWEDIRQTVRDKITKRVE